MNEDFIIPNNWKVVTLEDVAEGKNAIVDGPFGSNLKTSDYIDDKVNGVPVLTTKNLEGDYSDEKVRFISKDKFETLKRSQVNPGDILVAKIGSIGKTGIYPKNARTAIIPANLLKFTVSKKVNFDYVFFYLNSRGLQNRIRKIATATAQPAFNLTKFRKLLIPLPPLSEQQAIVSKMEELLSDLENGKQQLQTARQQLKIYRQSVLKWAFEGKLVRTGRDLSTQKDGELPKGWKIESLSKMAKIVSGFAFKSSGFVPHGIPVVKISNIGYSEFVRKDQQYLPKDFLKSNSDFVIRSGDLLLALTRPITNNTTKVCQYPSNTGDALLNQRVACIKELKANRDFIFLFFQTNAFKEYIRSKFSETLQPNLSPKDLALTPIPVCPLKEQHLIVQELESKLTVCDKIEETISYSLLQAETLRQSILKKAFEGKLA